MTKKSKIDHYSDKEALEFHSKGKSGKIEIISILPDFPFIWKSKASLSE